MAQVFSCTRGHSLAGSIYADSESGRVISLLICQRCDFAILGSTYIKRNAQIYYWCFRQNYQADQDI
jgi:hypothetical protein